MKKILIWCILFCCSYTFCLAELITYEQETYNVTVIVEQTCQKIQENIFRIERINHTSNSTPQNINYSTHCLEFETNITKNINKYTQSKTGYCLFNQTDNYSISFSYLNNTINFSKEIVCENELTNLTKQNNSVNLVEEEKEEIKDCFSQANIYLNRQVFEEEDQLTMDFVLVPKPKEFEITYWIETTNKTILKKERTTTNTNTKKHTFKKIEQEEQGSFVKAIISDDCQSVELEELILLTGEKKKKEKKEPFIDIISFEERTKDLKLTFDIQTTTTEPVLIEIISDTGTRIFSQEIHFSNEEELIEATMLFAKPNEKEVEIIIASSSLQDTKKLELKSTTDFELIRTYTKQTYYDKNISWYVRTKQEKPLLIEVNTTNSSTYHYVTQIGEHTSQINIPYQGGEIITTLYQGEEQQTTIDRPELIQTQKEITDSSTIVINTIAQQKETGTTTPLLQEQEKKQTNPLIIESESSKKNIFSRIPKQTIYGVLGILLAGLVYFILKE